MNTQTRILVTFAFVLGAAALVAGLICANNIAHRSSLQSRLPEADREIERKPGKTVAAGPVRRHAIPVRIQKTSVPRVRIDDLRNVGAFELNSRPNLIRIQPNTLFAGSFWSGTVCIFDLTTGRRKRRLVLVKSGDDVEIVEDNGRLTFDRDLIAPLSDLVVANGRLFILPAFAKSLVVLDTSTNELTGMLPLGGDGKLAASPDGRFVYHASNIKPEFHIIDTGTLKNHTVRYPKGGRGIGAIAISRNGRQLYLGISRGGRRRNGPAVGGGNTFLTVYDLQKGQFRGTTYLAEVKNGSSDDSWATVLLSQRGNRLYAGMFQSKHAYRVVDLKAMALDHDIDPPAVRDPTYPIPWPNVAGGGFVGDTLVSLHRGGEVHFWDTKRRRPIGILEVGAWSGRWTATAIVHHNVLYVAHPTYKCDYSIPVKELILRFRG